VKLPHKVLTLKRQSAAGELCGLLAGGGVVLVGEFFVSCLVSFSGLVGGGAGEAGRPAK
jgi:hypothetical protein